MAKKQNLASEISSVVGAVAGAVAARAEKIIASKPAKKTISKSVESAAAAPAKVATKPVAKRTSAAKHSKIQNSTVKPPATAAENPAPVVVLDRDEIAKQAYLYWEARGYQGGNPDEDWARAEAELKQRANIS